MFSALYLFLHIMKLMFLYPLSESVSKDVSKLNKVIQQTIKLQSHFTALVDVDESYSRITANI